MTARARRSTTKASGWIHEDLPVHSSFRVSQYSVGQASRPVQARCRLICNAKGQARSPVLLDSGTFRARTDRRTPADSGCLRKHLAGFMSRLFSIPLPYGRGSEVHSRCIRHSVPLTVFKWDRPPGLSRVGSFVTARDRPGGLSHLIQEPYVNRIEPGGAVTSYEPERGSIAERLLISAVYNPLAGARMGIRARWQALRKPLVGFMRIRFLAAARRPRHAPIHRSLS